MATHLMWTWEGHSGINQGFLGGGLAIPECRPHATLYRYGHFGPHVYRKAFP